MPKNANLAFPWLLGLALAASAAPAAAQAEVTDAAAAESRLRVCLSTGAPGAPRESLTAAVSALRSLCYPHIARLREFRLAEAEESLNLPAGRLTVNEKIERERAREEAGHELDAEITRAISSLTGLTKQNASDN